VSFSVCRLVENRGAEVKKLIRTTVLLIAGLLTSATASAYYVSGQAVYDSGNNLAPGSYSYVGYYLDTSGPIPLPVAGVYDGYLGNIHTSSPPAGINKGSIGTPYLVNPSVTSGSGGYVDNDEQLFPNVHWYRFTADYASILEVYYEWEKNVDSFSLDIFEYNGSDTPLKTKSFSSSELISAGGHYEDNAPGFTTIAAGEYLIRITGSATSSELNTYSVYLGASPVPLPPAALLFISALAGFGVIGRKAANKAAS
jgi:hypothetical protein